jgi:ABC-type uncharacterized transport system substrate-binding protein
MFGRQRALAVIGLYGHRLRYLVVLAAVLLLGAPGAVAALAAHPAAQVTAAHIGYLGSLSSDTDGLVASLRDGLAEAGWVEGENLTIEYRWNEGRPERNAALAADLVALNLDAIVTGTVVGVQALTQQTKTIPIVFANVQDPVGSGLIASIARPGGNVTGTSATSGGGTGATRLGFLKEIMPSLSRVAVVFDTGNPAGVNDLHGIQAKAQSLGVQIQPVGVASPDEREGTLNASLAGSPEALLTGGGGNLITPAAIAPFAISHSLPLIGGSTTWTAAGALGGYGPDGNESFRRVGAYYVDSILRGAMPADLPVEEPTSFALTLNRTAIETLGLTIPQSIADQVANWVD